MSLFNNILKTGASFLSTPLINWKMHGGHANATKTVRDVYQYCPKGSLTQGVNLKIAKKIFTSIFIIWIGPCKKDY